MTSWHLVHAGMMKRVVGVLERQNGLDKMTDGGEQLIAAQLSHLQSDLRMLMQMREDDRKDASESRRRLHEGQQEQAKILIDLTNRVQAIESSVAAEKPTWEEYRRMKEQANGAGKLGRALWRFGGFLMAFVFGVATTIYSARENIAGWWHWLITR